MSILAEFRPKILFNHHQQRKRWHDRQQTDVFLSSIPPPQDLKIEVYQQGSVKCGYQISTEQSDNIFKLAFLASIVVPVFLHNKMSTDYKEMGNAELYFKFWWVKSNSLHRPITEAGLGKNVFQIMILVASIINRPYVYYFRNLLKTIDCRIIRPINSAMGAVWILWKISSAC